MGDGLLTNERGSGHTAEIRALLNAYLTALDGLRPYGIESISDFAEYVFERALQGKRAGRGSKGHDVLVPKVGRVQVKERRLPSDGRIEERLHLRNVSATSCDYLGAIILNNDFTVRKATLVPHAQVWRMILSHPDPEKKVRYDLVASLPGATDMTERLRRVIR